MQKSRNLGIAMTILGLLLTCCLCPLAVNSILFVATSGGRPTDVLSLYGRLFTQRVGIFTIGNYISAGQEIAACLLALAILVLGIIAIVQTRKASA